MSSEEVLSVQLLSLDDDTFQTAPGWLLQVKGLNDEEEQRLVDDPNPKSMMYAAQAIRPLQGAWQTFTRQIFDLPDDGFLQVRLLSVSDLVAVFDGVTQTEKTKKEV